MGLFLSRFVNKVDKKGRISVPAQYRQTLAAESFNGIVAYLSFVNPCIEACGMQRIEQLAESIDTLDPYSEERDAFASTILGESCQLNFDSDGRITLPEQLIQGAEITQKAVFVGKGKTFEIWQEAKFEDYASKARKIAIENRKLLTLNNKAKHD